MVVSGLKYCIASKSNLCLINISLCIQSLSVAQLKKVRQLVEDGIVECDNKRKECGDKRKASLWEIGNLLHDSVRVSNDEVWAIFLVIHNSVASYSKV